MNKRLLFLSMLVLAGTFSLLPRVQAAGGLFAGQDVDPQFRAKVMKEKAKQNQQQANNFNFNNGAGNGPDAHCGSQSIGNVDTNGRIGTAPREVFVFAPNAINLVSAQGCK